MDFDFSKLVIPQATKPQTDPFKIFASLPRLEGAPNDLWRGQADALSEWHKNRSAQDVLVALNTGAGKTLVGLLIAKSLCNEGTDNVIYVCPTNDLVLQTAAQARAAGIEVTTRIDGSYDNDLFEVGKTFCITNYHAVFNGLSSIRRKHFPGAIIFDDAHVAEQNMRNAFTLQIKHKDKPDLFSAIANLFLPFFRNLGKENEYRDAFQTDRPASSVLIPPDAVRINAAQLEVALRSADVSNDKNMKYPYGHLRDHIETCAVIARGGIIEITPPFIPSLALDIFERRIRRVYLSATLENKADMVRAFGRLPSVKIEPSNDAGNGERLIITERELISSPINSPFSLELAKKHKVLVAVPSYKQAEQWASLTKPPETKDFSSSLQNFRNSKTGSFILVNRVDGIDLPHDTCRLMILDGVPMGESLIERFQFESLDMKTFSSSRIANRLVQLFGRINRGRSDYGAFLVAGRDLNVWLANDKNVALLPDLLKRQILLGRSVQAAMNIRTLPSVSALIDKVTLSRPRDQAWLNYYSQFLNSVDVDESSSERARRVEDSNLAAAQSEAIFAKAMWERNYSEARIALDQTVADVARADSKLAGWHNLWIGGALSHEEDQDQACIYYVRARSQLGTNLLVSTRTIGEDGGSVQATRSIVSRFIMMTNLGRDAFNRQIGTIERQLAVLDGGTPSQVEEAVRLLGETLGYESSRPDNDDNTGPDVFWRDTSDKAVLGIELKTDKKESSVYSKQDVSQSLDHVSWIDGSRADCASLGCVLVGPATGVHHQANPSGYLYSAPLTGLSSIRDGLFALIRDAYNHTPKDRVAFMEEAADKFRITNILNMMGAMPLRGE